VVGVDLKPCEFWEGDYRQLDLEDGAGVHDVFAGADAVVHFGSLPTDGWTSWETAYRNLSLGGYHVLQAAANLRIPRLVMASSPMVYGDYARMPYLPVDEESPQAPDCIYAAVKQNLEQLAACYSRWTGMAIAALRPQRIVYERSYEWRFRRFTGADDAAASSLWAYVDARDVASACLAWLQSDLPGFEVFNVAAADVCVSTPTRELVERFYPQVRDLRGDLPGCTGLVSCAKLTRLLGWSPQHSWQGMEEESRSQGFPPKAPPR
jgi:nucleoside-diphosphate-sugar epimerase